MMITSPYDMINNATLNTNRFTLESSLFDLCSKRCSGTLYIETTDNGTAIFILKNGVISDLTLKLKRELDAATLIKNEKYKLIEFHEDYFEPVPYDAKVSCSKTLLTHLGYDQFIAKEKLDKIMCYLMA